MRPRLLEVTNFLGHEHEAVAFPDSGAFFLSGESGAGKSSFIVDALAYALFGSKATRAGRQEELRHKDHPAEAMEVRVLFEFDDQSRLTLVRGLTAKGQSYAEAYQPDPMDPTQQLLLAETANRVSRIVRQRLGGMTWQQFYAAFVARQSEISMLTSLRGGERKDLVHRLLGMREMEQAIKEVQARLRTHRTQYKALSQALGEKTLDGEETRIAELEAQAAAEEARMAQAQKTLEVMQEQFSLAQAELGPLQQRLQSHASVAALQNQIEAERGTLALLVEQEQRQQENATLAASVTELEAEEKAVSTAVAELRLTFTRTKDYQKAHAERAAVAERLSELRAHVMVPVAVGAAEAEAPVTAESLRSRRALLAADTDRYAREIAERSDELDRLQRTGECFTCLRPLGEGHDHDQVLHAIQSKLDELRDASADAAQELESIAERLPVVEAAERDAAELRRQLDTAEADLARAEQTIAALQDSGVIGDDLETIKQNGIELGAQAQEAATKLARARAAAEALDASLPAKLAERRERISGLERELTAARAQAGEAVSDEQVRELSDRVRQLQAGVSAEQGKLPEMARSVERAHAAITDAKRELDALREKLLASDQATATILELEDLQTYIDQFQRKLAGEIRPALEEMGSEMLHQVSGGRHVAMRLDENYEIEVQSQEGTWLHAHMLSGGESIRVNICLRLAITRLVSARTGVPVRMLIFDEPLPSQDLGHVERIMELLANLRHWYPQIYIISHVGELRSSEHIDYVLEFGAQGPDRIQLVYA